MAVTHRQLFLLFSQIPFKIRLFVVSKDMHLLSMPLDLRNKSKPVPKEHLLAQIRPLLKTHCVTALIANLKVTVPSQV